jgi:hypothetical protein
MENGLITIAEEQSQVRELAGIDLGNPNRLTNLGGIDFD